MCANSCVYNVNVRLSRCVLSFLDMSDGFNNFVTNPLKDAAIGAAIGGAGDAFNHITEGGNEEAEEEEGDGVMSQATQFVFENFFA